MHPSLKCAPDPRCAEGYYSEFLWSGLRKELAHGGAKWLLPERTQSQEITYWAGKFLKMQVKLVFDQEAALAHKVGMKYVSLPFIMPEQVLRMKINLPQQLGHKHEQL